MLKLGYRSVTARLGAVAGVAAAACGSLVLAASPAAAGISTIDGSSNAVAIATGTGEWAADSAVAAAATGTAVATGTAAGLAGTAAGAVPGLTFGASAALSNTVLGAAAVAVGGWYASTLRVTGPVPSALAGVAGPPIGWTGMPTYANHMNSSTWLDIAVTDVQLGSEQTVTMYLTATSAGFTSDLGYFPVTRCASTLAGPVLSSVSQSRLVQPGQNSVVAVCPAGQVVYGLQYGTRDAAGTTDIVYWYPPSSSLRPADQVQGQGVLERKVDCVDATGLVTHLVNAASITLAADGSYPVGSMVCPAGSVTAGFGATWTPSGGTAVTVVPWTTTPGWVTAIPAQQPVCMTEVCYLRLYETGVAGAPATSCGDAAIACPDWYTDPAKTSRYECHWGPYVIDFNACSAFRKPGQVLPNTTTTTDPATGQKTGSATLVTSDPSTANDPATSPSGSSLPTPTSGDCFPSGWGVVNPVEWVLKPVGCALSWAFVPKNDVIAPQVASTRDMVMGKPPMSLFGTVGPVLTAVSSGWTDGCTTNLADFGVPGKTALPIPCHPPTSLAWTAIYVAMSGALVVVTGLNVWSMLVAALGGRTAAGDES